MSTGSRQSRKAFGKLRCINLPSRSASYGAPRRAVKKHISNIQTIMAMSSKKRMLMPAGMRVNNNAGRLIRSAPAPPAKTMEPHNNPGGSGSSGAVHSSRGSASRKRNKPGPKRSPKYDAKEFGPPLLMASTASTMSNIAAEEVCE